MSLAPIVARPAGACDRLPLSNHRSEETMPFTSGIGVTELIIVLVIVLVIFGPKRLPAMGRSLGAGMREFKDSISGKSRDDEDDEEKPELTAAEAPPANAQSRERARAEHGA
jgi:sec-independent protein translocase protein TatA